MKSAVIALSLLVTVAAAAPHHSKAGIQCYIGDAQDHEVVQGFKVCQATYNFAENLVELTGRHHGKAAAFSDIQVPGMSDTRTQECAIKTVNGAMVAECTCFEARCNTPVTPKELLEEKFRSL